ncbi:MAG TPA: inositol monophosphatase family protein [Gemmatimonadaceae bacterium]|nr:inositol monophosphatase family protein [Gemmatimonadaceae bacterium]
MQANFGSTDNDALSAQELLDIAVFAAAAAVRVIDDAVGGRTSLVWEEKGSADFVTEVDRAAESAIADVVRAHCRDATIIGEELSPEGSLAARGISFIVDPLDGTTNFLHDYPEYSVSIAVTNGSDLVAGVVRNLTKNETFTAVRNGGAYLNGERIAVSRESTLARALIGTGFPFKRHDLLEEYARQFIHVSRHTAGIRRAGSAALDLSNLACGRFDGFWELVLAPWDIAAGVLIVREAGGVVTDLDGTTKSISHGSVVAGNPDIQPWLLRTVQAAVEDHTLLAR